MTFDESRKYILSKISEAISAVPRERVETFAESIAAGDSVFVYGSGRSGLIARAFAMRVVQLGLRCYVVGDATTPAVEPKDVVVLISNTGKTKSTILVASICRRIGARILSVTSDPESPLARQSDVTVVIKAENCRPDLAPLGTLFEDAALVFLDAVVSHLMKHLGESDESMRARHAIWV